ncbi:hypothetical protein SUGI_0765980 [Cryptomeria japonica]|uniref:probable E3 ubiquitin-protein ligase RHA4A n=1 Tax=Cryptomeria japonica TaxID=3369 RepID=UPI002414C4E7|nr:probable E3 ubiquitin-protein ligase RHA4A [Cryptomeria japonica]GLJ37706.1 hypothetical protein SUGI_0765980 [Cryptomeria japonica]
MATPIHCRWFLNLPLTIRGRSPWRIWLMISWMIIVIAVPLFFKFVIHIDSKYPYIIFAVIILFISPVVFGKKKEAGTTAPAAVRASEPSTSDSRPRRSVDVEMEKFDYSVSKDEVEDGSGQLCVICLCNYEEDEQPALSLPACRHNFHVACIQRWLQCHGRCPICSATPISQHAFSQVGTDVVRLSVVVDAPESIGEERVDI